jgi:glycosyltransferase involved in cell wall biosynthesis
VRPGAGPDRDRSPTLRVACVEVNEDGTVGGSHRVLEQLAHGLRPRGIEYVPVFYQDNAVADTLRDAGFGVHVLEELRRHERDVNARGTQLQRLRKAVRAVLSRAAFLRLHRIDVLHLNNSPFIGFDDWLPAARLVGAACVVTAATRMRPQGHRLLRGLATSHDLFLPVSEHVSRALVADGVPASRICVIHPGVDIDRVRASVARSRDAVREELGVPRGSFLVLMVGNLREWKGQHVLLESLSHLPEDVRRQVHVCLVGDHSVADRHYVTRLRVIARDAGCESQVSFLGPRSDVPDLLAAADLAVHASIEPEPFGLVVVEAMALGVPLIASADGGPAEIVDESSGLLVPPADPAALALALGRVAADQALRRTMSDAACRRARRFDLAHSIDAHVSAYARLRGRGHRAAPEHA